MSTPDSLVSEPAISATSLSYLTEKRQKHRERQQSMRDRTKKRKRGYESEEDSRFWGKEFYG